MSEVAMPISSPTSDGDGQVAQLGRDDGGERGGDQQREVGGVEPDDGCGQDTGQAGEEAC